VKPRKISNYCIELNGYYISKVMGEKEWVYMVYKGKDFKGKFKTPEEAKEFCK